MPVESVLDTAIPCVPATPASPLRAAGKSRLLTVRLAREPLLHFLLLGLLLYAASSVWGAAAENANQSRIEITPAEIKQMRVGWATQWNRQPTTAELKELIDGAVREEIMYREAMASGLDRNDSIIRRRLVQKIQFLMQDPSLLSEPGDAELIQWLHEHSARYAREPSLDFTQLFFSSSRPDAYASAMRSLQRLRANRITPAAAGDIGEPFIDGNDFHSIATSKSAQQFGSGFAQSVSRAPLKTWIGPLRSPFGFHLVWVESRTSGATPAFASIRPQLLTDYMQEQIRTAEQSEYAKLRSHYVVHIDRETSR